MSSPRVWTLMLAGFSALSCFAGGMELLILRRSSDLRPPLDSLRFTPFHDLVCEPH